MRKIKFRGFFKVPEQCANINDDAVKITCKDTNDCDFINTYRYDIGKITNENINKLNVEQRLDILLHPFKPESLFSFPNIWFLGCNRYCEIDYLSYPFVYSKIKDLCFCLNFVLCLALEKRESAAEQLCMEGNTTLDKQCTHLVTKNHKASSEAAMKLLECFEKPNQTHNVNIDKTKKREW